MKTRIVTNGTYYFPQYREFLFFWRFFTVYDKSDVEFNYPRRELFGTLEKAQKFIEHKLRKDPKEQFEVVWESE